uniref:Lipid desaturase domain-containing protein n=1 Tax=Anopheles coluzzii TaxID=1518534 RepID=A0A8W7P708_ANOCL
MKTPVKTDQEIHQNSMLEGDPNSNTILASNEQSEEHSTSMNCRDWGPRHKGAQELVNLYGNAEAAIFGILTANFGSGPVHWGADSWGSIDLPIVGKIHKWSHAYWRLLKWILFLHNHHIILPRHHHRIHYVTPHETYFCITTGD